MACRHRFAAFLPTTAAPCSIAPGSAASVSPAPVNFLLNRHPGSGCLVVYKGAGPSDWAFRTYSADRSRIARSSREAGGGDPVTAPQRRNRAMIFASDLFNRTADLDFRPAYGNRCVNLTMLLSYHSEGG